MTKVLERDFFLQQELSKAENTAQRKAKQLM